MEVFEDGLEQRYYYIEESESYGQRQMGALEGYESIEELKRDQRYSIELNKERKLACWIVKREIVEKLV